ncbi:hypothetical protein HWV62_1675 [Athelia sp. TMB]|nr:hypothetical protein HWV62_1675 [Athelia sp. TMB]
MSRQSFEHRRPLLPEEDIETGVDDKLSYGSGKPTSHMQPYKRRLMIVSALLIASILLNISQAWSAQGIGRFRVVTGIRPDESYSPAYDAVEYELRKFSRARWISPWHGPPSDAVDAAWESLYSFGINKIPKSEAAKMLNRTVALPGDEGNYVVALDVFHQLHCLNQVRKALHPNYYPPQKIVNGFDHIDHCVNSIRESLTCSADITPNTWIWNQEKQMAAPRLDNMHMCRNFDKIQEWARAREMTAPWNKTVHVEDDLEYTIIY